MNNIKTNKLSLESLTEGNINFKGEFNTTNNLHDLVRGFNKASIFYEIKNNAEVVGIIGLEVIQAMNEFKLAKLHFEVNSEDYLDEALKSLLDFAIKDYYTVKIISVIDPDNAKAIRALLRAGFILNRTLEIDEKDYEEYKITKPMYLGR